MPPTCNCTATAPPPTYAALGDGPSPLVLDRYKSLPEEEEKMKRRKELAVALMEPSPSTGDDHEIKSINNLFALLDLPPDNNAHSNVDLEKQVRELRSLVKKKKKAMLIQLLDDNDKDGHGKEHKTEELAAAARQLRDALTQQRQNSGLHTLCTDLEMLKESLAASRIESESANALANSVCTDLERVKKSLAVGRSESEKAYGLSLFPCFASAGAAITAIAHGMI